MYIYRKSPLWVTCVSVFSWLVMMVANPGRAGVGAVGPASRHVINSRGCVEVDSLCLSPADVSNYEAIRTLHTQLDDDRNGDIDIAESVEFLKDELQYTKGFEKRQETFHRNNDRHISVADLWHIWKQSEVHNWTVEQTVAWLGETVELSMYAKNFYENAINGSVLPRLAANNEHFINRVLGIKDPKHRSKITIKAMDAVLFGPPKGSHLKDLVLVTLLTLALLGCFKAYQRNREYQAQLSNMMKDMEKLREAEENLQSLEKNIRNPLRRASAFEDGDGNSPEYVTNEVVQQLRQELEEEREKCYRLQQEMEGVESEDRGGMWDPPIALQHWLQLTYERERLAFEKKHLGAREQFNQAKEMCEKLNKQRRSLMGMLSSVHGKMDNIDQSISKARTTMEEVTQELSERDNRWSNIEMLGGFNITKNSGLHTLELMLRPQVNGGRPHSIYAPSIGRTSNLSASIDDFDDDSVSLFSHTIATPTIHEVNSVNDIRLGGVSSLSSRKKSHLFTTRDSGSSIGSDSSTTAAAARMRYSQNQNFSSGLSICASSVEEEVLPRSASTSSLRASLRSSSQIIKDDSSTDERDHSPSISDSTSFSMGGSRLTLNSEGGRTITESQVSPSPSPCLSVSSQLLSDQVLYNDICTTKPLKKKTPMLKSYSQDAGTGATQKAKQKACENMSASEPALDNPKTTTSSSLRCKQITVTSFEEGNSSDSSLNSSLPSPNSEQIKKKKWFTSSISSRLSMGKSKKKKEKELDKDKETSKQESVSIKSLDKDKESSKQESISGKA